MDFKELDKNFINLMHLWGVTFLRISLGIIFLWFGGLKIFGISPVAGLIRDTYSFFPQQSLLLVLGIWEVLIGLGLIFKIYLRATLFLLWLQMAGTFIAIILEPSLFFNGINPLALTMDGEFLLKNLVLIASSMVIGGHGVDSKEF